MAFLRTGLSPEPLHAVEAGDLLLRAPMMGDYAQWARLRALSRDHLVPWEPIWPRDELSRWSYRRRVRHYQREAREDGGYAFLLFQMPEETLLGGLTLANVRRGVAEQATLGYWLGVSHVGQGYMTRAVRALIGYAFTRLGLHRIEAASMQSNTASIRVLERAGFRCEGLARRYLKINGAWRDHLLFAVLAEDFDPGGTGRAP